MDHRGAKKRLSDIVAEIRLYSGASRGRLNGRVAGAKSESVSRHARTFAMHHAMSALPMNAVRALRRVSVGPNHGLNSGPLPCGVQGHQTFSVRFAPESGHVQSKSLCLLRAISESLIEMSSMWVPHTMENVL